MKKNRIFGILFLCFGIFFLLCGFVREKVHVFVETKAIQEKIVQKQDYFAILEIPQIHLKKELYSIDDKRNQVDQNIFVHENSVLPKNGTSNLILAGHSGTGKHAYFKDLYRLKVGDIVKLYYEGHLYHYQIKEIEYQEKTGELYLKNEFSDMITLITCTYQDKRTQTIYYAKLEKIEIIGRKK